jgi:hypothetical protein
MRHVHQQIGADRIRDLAETSEVDTSRICTRAGYDKLGAFLQGNLHDLFIVNGFGVVADSV